MGSSSVAWESLLPKRLETDFIVDWAAGTGAIGMYPRVRRLLTRVRRLRIGRAHSRSNLGYTAEKSAGDGIPVVEGAL